MLPKRNYYLNDYFDLFDKDYYKEKEYLKTDIYQTQDKYIIETEVAGIKKDNIKINYQNGYLTINISKLKLSANPNTYIRRERYYGELKRSFYIGIKNVSDIKASYQESILKISFPIVDLKENSNNINII